MECKEENPTIENQTYNITEKHSTKMECKEENPKK